MIAYWPCWLVALALGAMTVGYWIALRRPLGVSGVLARFSRIREEARFDRGYAVLQADDAALEAAMAAATAEAFGPLAPDPSRAEAVPAREVSPEWPAPAPERPAGAPRGRICAPTPPLSAHAVFLVAIVVGGFLAAVVRGTFGHGLGAAFEATFTAAPLRLVALLGGGVLVGFGTALCGGCSGGHGLTGCGRLMPGSLLATAVFFASAMGTSLLLAWRVA